MSRIGHARRGLEAADRWPITGLAKDYPAGSHVARHRHRRGQLVHAESGVLRVETREGVFIVPHQRALWIPPRMAHESWSESAVALRTLYLDPRTSARFASRCRVLLVSKLLRELILEAVRAYHARDARRLGVLSPLLVDELLAAGESGLCIPTPSDPRLVRACELLLRDASRTDSIEAMARRAGASVRTLARLFERDLGMTFVRWRQQVRLARALDRITAGEPIKRVSREAGYVSSSAFGAMFRRVLGSTPTAHRPRRA
jgi:AraC-like DNA-binding protein